MNAEEKFTKAEQEVEKAIQKLADAKRKANDLKRTEENKRKFFIGGLFAKYLREELNLELLALSKEETTRVIALAMKHRDPYQITPPKAEGERWQTYITKESGCRKLVQASTEHALLVKLAEHYCINENIENLTFHDLFIEWLAYYKTVANNPNTILCHKQRYDKYFAKTKLHDMKFRKVDEITLDQECNRIIKEHNLTRKEWTNTKTILNGMYKYAMRKKYITENPLPNIVISVKYKQVNKKTGKTETYDTDELNSLNAYLDEMFAQTHDSSFIAVKLNFLLGLRVAELVALKWADIEDERHIHVMREEVRDQETGTVCIVDHTKTNQDRFVALVPKGQSLLELIDKTDEYIFVRDGKRITARQIAYVLVKYAQRMGVSTKSTHKMRKTYASLLNAHGVPLDFIREQLGHNNLNTTLGYIYNPLTEKETYDLLAKALN